MTSDRAANAAYYAARAVQERTAALVARCAKARDAHIAMAEVLEKLATGELTSMHLHQTGDGPSWTVPLRVLT